MCKNATKTAADLMTGIRPTIVSLLTIEGIISTPEGTSALAAYDAADQALANWVPGTDAQVVIEGINAFESIFNTLPLPEEDKTLANLILAGVSTVIGIITANSPAPSTAESQETHIAEVTHDTTVKVKALVPSFKRAIFSSPSKQYKNAWDDAVEKLGGKYVALKQ